MLSSCCARKRAPLYVHSATDIRCSSMAQTFREKLRRAPNCIVEVAIEAKTYFLKRMLYPRFLGNPQNFIAGPLEHFFPLAAGKEAHARICRNHAQAFEKSRHYSGHLQCTELIN